MCNGKGGKCKWFIKNLLKIFYLIFQFKMYLKIPIEGTVVISFNGFVLCDSNDWSEVSVRNFSALLKSHATIHQNIPEKKEIFKVNCFLTNSCFKITLNIHYLFIETLSSDRYFMFRTPNVNYRSKIEKMYDLSKLSVAPCRRRSVKVKA